MPPETIHNIFLDHVDHSGESEHHHHHGPNNNDILWHKHDGSADHLHFVVNNDNDATGLDQYGPADHTHDKPATDDLNKPLYFINEHRDDLDLIDDGAGHIVIHPAPTDESTSVDWADDLDNLTGNNPYNYTS